MPKIRLEGVRLMDVEVEPGYAGTLKWTHRFMTGNGKQWRWTTDTWNMVGRPHRAFRNAWDAWVSYKRADMSAFGETFVITASCEDPDDWPESYNPDYWKKLTRVQIIEPADRSNVDEVRLSNKEE